MTSRPNPAIRLLGSATLLLGLPSGVLSLGAVSLGAVSLGVLPASAAPVEVAQAAAPPPATQPAPLTVPVQGAPPDAAAPDGSRHRDDRRAFVEAGIAALHAGLLLSPAQQGLWPPVEAALRDLAATRGGMRRGRDGEGRGFADPLARLKERGARIVARGQAMEKLADAAAPLFAALTPEQKERVPELLHRIMPRRMMFGGHGGHGMREHGMDGRGMDGRGMDGRGMDDDRG